MECPTLAVARDERHRVVLPVHLGLGLRQDLDGMISNQASVEFVLGVKVGHAAYDRLVR